MNIEAIAHIKSDFPTKFGIPRQSGLADALEAKLIPEHGFGMESLKAVHFQILFYILLIHFCFSR